jgi:hypothetical protein
MRVFHVRNVSSLVARWYPCEYLQGSRENDTPEARLNSAKLTVRVASKRAIAEGIAALELVTLDASPLPPFSAGSHIDVHVSVGDEGLGG